MAVVIKLADRLHNLKVHDTLPEVARKEGDKWFAAAILNIFAALADRLGMQQVKEVLEDGAFPARQKERAAADADIALDCVERDIAGMKGRSESAAGTPQERIDPRNELRHCERLDEVVIGSRVQPAHAIVDRVAGREHQNGGLVAGGPHVRENAEPVAVGQPQVQHHGVVGREREGLASVGAPAHRIDRKADPLQGCGQNFCDPSFVLYDQEAHVSPTHQGLPGIPVRPCTRGAPGTNHTIFTAVLRRAPGFFGRDASSRTAA